MENNNLTIWQKLSQYFGPHGLSNQEYPIYTFDKKELLRTQSKSEYEREKLQAQQTWYLANQWAKIENNMYSQAVYYEPTRLSSVYDYESMEYTPEISTALDIYAEESTTTNEDGEILGIFSESKRIRSILTDLFINVLDVNTNLSMWTRNTCKYGDNFVYLKLDPEKGIVGCQQLPNIEIQRIEPGSSEKSPLYLEKSEPTKSLHFRWTNKSLEFQPWEIAHFRILGDDRKLPYGTCLKYDTLIDTEYDVKQIKDIEKGDLVWSFDLQTQEKELSKVLDVINSGIKKCYKLQTKNNFVEASEEHRILIYQNEEFVYKNVLDILVGDVLVIDEPKMLPKQYILEEIISITDVGEHETYDIYVENENHNFYANGIVVHNSMLEKARRTWKQLLLGEDAMLIYRTSRAPERRVFKIFVGNMSDEDVEPYVNRIANKFKREQIVDSKSGNVDMRYNQMAVDQDYFVPVRDPAAPSPIETLPGACISLDTRIPLLDGRTLTLNEIISEWDSGERNLWVYSCNPVTGEIAPGVITWAGVTRKNANVLKITLDNGKEIVSTPDHKFVHREKGFVEAKDLIVGDSLMPFYTREEKINRGKSRYKQVWDNNNNSWVFSHRMVGKFMKNLGKHNEFVFDEKYINESKNTIHHKDINRYNNNPDNLYFMNNADHYLYHSKNINLETCVLGGKAMAEKLRNNPEKYDYIKKIQSEKSKDFWTNISEEKKFEIRKKQSQSIKAHIDNLSDEQKSDRFSKNIHKKESIEKVAIKLKIWSSCPENLKHRGRIIKNIKNRPEQKRAASERAQIYWSSDEYRDKVFSKRQNLIFNDFIFAKFVQLFDKFRNAKDTIKHLNLDEEFMREFKEINKDIRSSLTNLTEFTHNHLEKMLKSKGYRNFKEWRNKPNEFYNHKIVNIEFCDYTIDTGTITVDGNEIFHNFHTFAIESGIFIKNSNLGEIADIEYIQRKLVTALRIPKAFLGFEESVGDGKTLALQDIRFARTINRIQKSMISELNKIAIIHLYLLGFDDELTNFKLTLTNPSTQADLLKVDIWKEKIQLYKDAVSDPGSGIQPVSATWAKKHIFGFSDEDIRVDLQQQRIERAVGEELKATPLIIKKTGLFDNLDKLYADVTGVTTTTATQSTTETPPMPDLGGGMDITPSELPAPETGTEEAPTTETPMESRFNNLNLLIENDIIEGKKYLDLSQGAKSLKDLDNEIERIV